MIPKFRAWIKNENKMVEVKALDWNENGQIIAINYPNGRTIIDEDIVIMPYIGREDKNGIEIYEGDIVATTFNNYKFKVIWDSEYNSYRLQNITFNWDILELTSHKLHAIEVIGNIYETPELLGGN